VLLLARNSISIATGAVATGEVDRETDFEKVEGFWTVRNEHFVQDEMTDDQALAINVRGKGLVIVSGCAHSGIINTIRSPQKITGTNNIQAIIGGFHLEGAVQDTLHTARHTETLCSPSVICQTDARLRDHGRNLRKNRQSLETGTWNNIPHAFLVRGERLRGKRT